MKLIEFEDESELEVVNKEETFDDTSIRRIEFPRKLKTVSRAVTLSVKLYFIMQFGRDYMARLVL